MMSAVETLPVTLGELVDDVPEACRHIGIGGLSLDSSSIRPGDAFLACAGTRRHGLDYAAAAVEAGAVVVLYEPREGVSEEFSQTVPHVAIERLREKAGHIAGRFYGEPSQRLSIAGITGTNGKTTTARLIAEAAETAGLACGMSGTLGFGRPGHLESADLTTPDAVVMQERLARLGQQGATHVAMEVSSHALDQHRVEGVVFHTAAFTNLSRDHLDYHGDMQSYLDAKRALFSWPGLRNAVINVDDPAGAALATDIASVLPVTAVGASDAVLGFDALRIRQLDTSANGLRVALTTPWGDAVIDSSLLGDFNATNLALALAVLTGWGLEVDEGAAALAGVQAVRGRMEAFGGGAAPLVVVDYAHTPDALDNALRALRKHCDRDLWVVFGCGGERDRGKRPQMGEIAARLADRVVITDDNPRGEDPLAIIEDIREGVNGGDHIESLPGRRDAIAYAIGEARPGDVVLVAGKGHEDYQLVGNRRLSLSDREEARRLVGERQ